MVDENSVAPTADDAHTAEFADQTSDLDTGARVAIMRGFCLPNPPA